MLTVAIDIGGTFTDVVAETSSGFSSIKVLTDHSHPEIAALNGLEQVLHNVSHTTAAITRVVHGTTLATNALIERKGSKTAFITTAGFRDVLEMRHEKRFDQYALDIQMPVPLVPRPLRLGITERILADGSVHIAPQLSQIDALAQLLIEQQVEAVAIGFLHAYKNAAHELYVAERLRTHLGENVTICQSAEVSGEIREYERFSTVCANAFVRPLMSRYLERLEAQLLDKGFTGPLMIMLSDGGLTTLEEAKRFPVRLIEGGPAGGVALAAHVARGIGSEKTLSLDIGGTTAKICFIENGKPETTRTFEVARAWRDAKGSGLPVNVPTVQLVEIGAGGGSIAAVDTMGRLKIGPKSAGAEPGPASYNQGGTAATITDAHLSTGNIVPEGFAAGIINLMPEQGGAAITEQVQTPLGMSSTESAAAGIIELADETMANAARVHGAELGLDISRFDLLVSGGGGGLHAARIADKLGIRRIIVPANAGVGSAVGFLRSPVAFERVMSVVQLLDEIDNTALSDRLADARITVCDIVLKAVPQERISVTAKAELRYRGQGHVISIDLQEMDGFVLNLNELGESFTSRYQSLMGLTLTDVPIELVSVSVKAQERQQDRNPEYVSPVPASTFLETRRIYDLIEKEALAYKVIKRNTLNDQTHTGPVVITEDQTTTLVRPGWTVRALHSGHLIVERAP